MQKRNVNILCFMLVWVWDPGQRLQGIGQFWSLVSLDCTISCPGPWGGMTKLSFRCKNILCFRPSFHIWISLIVHFCDLPSVCIERQELIVLLISFPVNSAARGGSSNKTHFSSFCRRPRISTSARSFFNDCLAASFAQPWFGIFCSSSHHCCIFALQDLQVQVKLMSLMVSY